MHSPLTPDSKRRRYNCSTASNNGRRLEGAYYSHDLHSRRDSLPPIQMRPSPPNTATMPPPRLPHEIRRGSVDLNILVPNQHDQSRSVEAMVMSVPYTIKIKVLGRITPAFKDPGPTSPAIRVRGAIIAVEGDDLLAVQKMADWLKEFLGKDTDYIPRMVNPPTGPKGEATFEDYLVLIKEWQEKSREMISYITTPITPLSTPTSSLSEDSAMATTKEEQSGNSLSSPPIASPAQSPRPVIILPTYQLRASDIYASKIPIRDAYSPMDHWQWMATLWRGTVGPDLTIYVKNAGKEEGAIGSAKSVEVNEGIRCLIVSREKDGIFADAALRRVGFEVCEWLLRGSSSGKNA